MKPLITLLALLSVSCAGLEKHVLVASEGDDWEYCRTLAWKQRMWTGAIASTAVLSGISGGAAVVDALSEKIESDTAQLVVGLSGFLFGAIGAFAVVQAGAISDEYGRECEALDGPSPAEFPETRTSTTS